MLNQVEYAVGLAEKYIGQLVALESRYLLELAQLVVLFFDDGPEELTVNGV